MSAGHVLGESVMKAESLVTQRTQPLGSAWTGRVQINSLKQSGDDTTCDNLMIPWTQTLRTGTCSCGWRRRSEGEGGLGQRGTKTWRRPDPRRRSRWTVRGTSSQRPSPSSWRSAWRGP